MSISQSSTVGNNYQAFEFVPLIAITTNKGEKYYFQLTDRDPLMVDNVVFNYLNGGIQNVSGSAIPYTPYRYRFHVANDNNVMVPRKTNQVDMISSLLKLIDDADGLRDSILSIYYYYPQTERMDRQGTFVVNSTTISTEKIVFDLINDIR